MKRKLFPLTFFVVLLLTTLTAYGQTCGIHCGTERWAVKTLTDTTVGNIDSTEVTKTINWVRTRLFNQEDMYGNGSSDAKTFADNGSRWLKKEDNKVAVWASR